MSAKVVLDSVNPDGKRLIGIEACYWRAIHSEIMTHRVFARNAASSRAIPFHRTKDGAAVANCTYSKIKDNPFLPQFIGTEQKGMQSGDELAEPHRSLALEIISELKDKSLVACLKLHELGVHKSIINRYLEPWSYITVLITSTSWNNFFRLRIHPAAEKHFNALAGEIKTAISASRPTPLDWGGWHLPYLGAEENLLGLENRKKVSAARCARLSYLTQDGRRDISEDLGLFDRLMPPGDVIHASALEHVAMAERGRSGCFNGWKQFRKEFANEFVED